MKVPSIWGPREASVGLVLLAAAAATAEAGSITSATGPIRVNGQEVLVEPDAPLALVEGDVVESASAGFVWVSEAGDRVTVEPGSSVTAEGVEDEVDYLFVKSGAAYGSVTARTSVGGVAGWASASEGEQASVFVEAPLTGPANETAFRSIEGTTTVRYGALGVWLYPQHSVTLAVDPEQPLVLAYRTSQQNPGDVEIVKTIEVGRRTIHVLVPKATVGRIAPEGPDKTRIDNDISSLPTAKLQLQTYFSGRDPDDPDQKPTAQADLGPGTYAVVDHATGGIQVSFTAVEFVILERAISLTNEFATLTQSNFSDVGVGRR